MAVQQTKVRESAKFVAENAEHVKVNESKCQTSAKIILSEMEKKAFSAKTWSSHELTPKNKNKSTVDWIFTVDLLNFSFWSNMDSDDSGKPSSQRYTVEYMGKFYTGYWSLVAAINKALDSGIPITTPTYWISDGFSDRAKKIFKSETVETMPMFEERIAVLQEAGAVFTQLGYTSFADLIDESGSSAQMLLQKVVQNFSSFNDVHEYKGNRVEIFKRAQILIADIWACFEGEGMGRFDDIGSITMFADYRVPQILHTFGCLEYSPELYERIMKFELIPSGDPMEVELRTCSIWAVELIVEELKRADPTRSVNAILVDFYLWDSAKELQAELGGVGSQVQCHRTRSVFY